MSRVRTASGRSYSIIDPCTDDVLIADIAHGLSNICGWQGQTPEFYSLAEHAVHVASIVPESYRLAALLHEAEKAYIGDATFSPGPLAIKNLQVILAALRVELDEFAWEHTKRAKQEIMNHEAFVFFGTGKASEHLIKIQCLPPLAARTRFLDLYSLLTGQKVPRRIVVLGDGGQRLAKGLGAQWFPDKNAERDLEAIHLAHTVITYGDYAEAALALGKRVIFIGKTDIDHPSLEKARNAREGLHLLSDSGR